MEDLKKYLEPTLTIESDNKTIIEKANELIQNQEDIKEKAKSLFYFIRDQIRYTIFVQIRSEEDYKATTTLQNTYGYCVQKAVLMTALSRAAGIPARLAFADIVDHMLPQQYIDIQGTNVTVYHGFVELYLNDRWITVDPAYDLKASNKYRLFPVEFDGEHDAKIHPEDIDGKLHTEYVKFHGSFQDLPHAQIIEGTRQAYGQKFFELWYDAMATKYQASA